MRPALRPELVSKYFVPRPIAPNYQPRLVALGISAVIALLGLVLLSQGSENQSAWGVFFLLSGLICGGYLIRWLWAAWNTYRILTKLSTPRATDQQMQNWLDEAISQAAENIGPRRLNLLPHELRDGIGEDVLPFVGIPDGVLPYQVTRGDDGVVRFSAYKILVAFLVEWRIATFECVVDLHTGAFITDDAEEYHLKQVDGVKISSDRIAVVIPDSNRHPLTSGTPSTIAGAPSKSPLGTSEKARPPDIVQQTTSVQILRLVVSGRVAVHLTMRYEIDGTFHEVGVLEQPSDIFINKLRDHLRGHMGGAKHPPAKPGIVPGVSTPTEAIEYGSNELDEQGEPATRNILAILQSLPFNQLDSPATAGILLTSDNRELSFRRGGRVAEGAVLEELGITGESVEHIEVQVAAYIHQVGIPLAALVINGVPCEGPTGCQALIPRVLPAGAQLTVYGPDFVSTYVGGREPPPSRP